MQSHAEQMIRIFGHQNPDTDSVTSAIALSYLKNQQGYFTKPYILGPINKETEFVLSYFEVENPPLLHDVKTQISDLTYDKVEPMKPYDSILRAYFHMNKKKIRTLPIVDDEKKLVGLLTMRDIAMNAIHSNSQMLTTTFDNIKHDLNAEIFNYSRPHIKGNIFITALHKTTIIENDIFDDHSIIITGDRFDVIEYAIQCRVQLIIVTGGQNLPQHLKDKAAILRVNILITPFDTYETSKRIHQINDIETIMKKTRIEKFKCTDTVEACKEHAQTSKHSKFPVVDKENHYLGIVGRRQFLNPCKKKVILVDHNEYSQSVFGLEEAEIIEIIDHHKLGDIHTHMPISFRNMPVGSTNTIIFQMFEESQIEIPRQIAGLLCSGIISDTLFLKSPTTTEYDRKAYKKLEAILKLDLSQYASEMFKSGTSLEGKTVENIFNTDFKKFFIDGYTVGVSQIFTMDVENLLNSKTEYLQYIETVHKEKSCFITLFLITDIINEGSYLLYVTENELILNHAFNQKVSQGLFLEHMVSRKKQIVPKLVEAIQYFR